MSSERWLHQQLKLSNLFVVGEAMHKAERNTNNGGERIKSFSATVTEMAKPCEKDTEQ